MSPKESAKNQNPPWWRNPVVILLALTIVGTFLYAHTLDYNFHFDSINGILNKDRVQLSDFSADALLNAVKNSRPVGNLTLALNWYIHQKSTAGYRIVNIAIHVLTAFFLYLFAGLTLRLAWPEMEARSVFSTSLGASLLWLVHPVNTQSVTYIIQRHNSLAAMFFLLSMLCYALGRVSASRRRWLVAAAVSGVFALASKQNTIVLPFFLFLYEWFFIKKFDGSWLKKNVKYPLALAVAIAAVGLLYLGAEPLTRLTQFRDYADGQFTITERFLTQFRVVVHYLALFFVPHPSQLNIDYDFSLSHSLFDPATTALSLLMILCLVGLAIFRAKRFPLLSFGILWFFGTLAVESSFVPLAVIFEHRTYLPYTFLCLSATAALYRIVRFRWAPLLFAVGVSAVFGTWTFQRNQVYQNGLTLWSDVIEKAPGNARAYGNLGTVIEKREDLRAASAYYEAALERDPNQGEALYNLGRVRFDQGRYDEALKLFDRASRKRPNFTELWLSIGSTYMKLGRIGEAVEAFRHTLLLDPDHAGAEKELGTALMSLGMGKEAKGHLVRAVEIDPDFADARVNLAAAQMQQGDFSAARVHLEKALAIDPKHPKANNNLGTLLIQWGEIKQAERHFAKALQSDPGFETARENLEQLLAMADDPQSKINELNQKLRSDPKNPVLHWQRGRLMAGTGRLEEAIESFEKAIAADENFLPALNDAAALYAHIGREKSALRHLKKIGAIDPGRADAFYNAACMYARLDQPEEALAWLRQAIEKGYRRWEQIRTDPDLESIHGTEAFEQLMQKEKMAP